MIVKPYNNSEFYKSSNNSEIYKTDYYKTDYYKTEEVRGLFVSWLFNEESDGLSQVDRIDSIQGLILPDSRTLPSSTGGVQGSRRIDFESAGSALRYTLPSPQDWLSNGFCVTISLEHTDASAFRYAVEAYDSNNYKILEISRTTADQRAYFRCRNKLNSLYVDRAFKDPSSGPPGSGTINNKRYLLIGNVDILEKKASIIVYNEDEYLCTSYIDISISITPSLVSEISYIDFGRSWIGYLDWFNFINKPLTNSQINDIINSGNGTTISQIKNIIKG